jgi:hypothetical protein
MIIHHTLLPFILTLSAIIVVFRFRRQLAGAESGNTTLSAFLTGIACIVPYLIIIKICQYCGADNPYSIEKLLLFSFLVALFTEAPKYLLLRAFLNYPKKKRNVWKCILMSVPFSTGFILIFLIVELLLYTHAGETSIRMYTAFGLAIVIGIISGFFIGMEKTAGAKFIHPLLGITTSVILNSITGISVYLKDYGLLIFFGAGLGLICLLLAYSAYLLRYDIETT